MENNDIISDLEIILDTLNNLHHNHVCRCFCRLSALIFLTLTGVVHATSIAYDCNTHSNITKISLNGVAECPLPS